MIGKLYILSALISCTPSWKSVEFWLTLVLFSLHQMTPLHLAVGSNRIKMVECFLEENGGVNLQDDNEVIVYTNAINYFELAGRCCTHRSFSLPFENHIVSLPKLGSDLYLE